jgi:hypothetical protein
MDTYIIAFGHRARSGKDTAIAEIIKRRGKKTTIIDPGYWFVEGQDIRRYGFGDELKREVTQAALSAGGMRQLFGTWEFYQGNKNGADYFIELPEWVRNSYEERPDMTDPLCPFGKQRGLLQWWGTELRRNFDADYWVNKLSKRIEKEKPAIALINDLRFPNEMRWVKQSGGETIRVDNPRVPPLTQKSHYSERALANVPDEDWTRILVNDETLEQFRDKAVDAFDTLMEFFPYGNNEKETQNV